MAAQVIALGVRDAPDDFRSDTRTDTQTGYYELPVSTGQYIMALSVAGRGPMYYAEDGMQRSRFSADTLDVRALSNPPRVDIHLGSLDLQLRLPDLLPAQTVSARLRGPWGFRVRPDLIGGSLSLRLDGVPPGEYALEIYLETSTARTFWTWPPSQAPNSSEGLTILAGETTTLRRTLPTPARVRGEISGSWLEMGWADPPSVKLIVGSEDEPFAASASVSEDGCFELFSFRSGVGRLRAKAADRIVWLGGDSYENADAFDITLGGEVTDIHFPDCGIWGEISLPPGSPRALQHAYAYLWDSSRSTAIGWCSAPGGIFRFPLLRPGTYSLLVAGARLWEISEPLSDICAPWLSQWFDAADTQSEAAALTLTDEDDVRFMRVNVLQGGSIRGAVSGPHGEPLREVQLAITTPAVADGQVIRIWRTERDGTFHVCGLRDGEYKLGVEWGDSYIWYPGTADLDSASTIQISDLGEVRDVQIFILD